MQTIEISTYAGLEELRQEWDDLLNRSRNASIFQTWEWLSSCRRHYGHGKQLMVLAIRDQGRLMGLAPMEIAPAHHLPLRRLRFLGNDVSDYLDFPLDVGHEQEALGAIFAWIAENSHRWDVLDFQKVPEGSPTMTAWRGAAQDLGWQAQAVEYDVCPYIQLPSQWDDLLSTLGKKMRSTLNYRERLVCREFHAEFEMLANGHLEEGVDALFRLHSLRWEKDGQPGVLADARRQALYRDVAWLFDKRGWLRLYGLRLNGTLQSVHYCFTYRDKAYGYLGGWDPSYSRYGLGTVLTAFAMRDAIGEGLREFDFLAGDEPYKAYWTRERRINYRLLAKKSGLRSLLAHSVCGAEQCLGPKGKMAIRRSIFPLKRLAQTARLMQ